MIDLKVSPADLATEANRNGITLGQASAARIVLDRPTSHPDTGDIIGNRVTRLSTTVLLDQAAAHPEGTIRELGSQIRRLLEELRESLATATEIQTIETDLADLEQRRQHLQERLAVIKPQTKRKKRTAATRSSEATPAGPWPIEHDAKVVRAWAAAQGLRVHPHGSVPREIVEDWYAATHG